MNIKYLLLITLTLPAAPMFAMQGGGAPAAAAAPNAGGNNGAAKLFNWENFAIGCTEKVVVGLVGAAIGVVIKEWMNPDDKNNSILNQDKVIENTRQQIQNQRHLAATTTDKEIAARCLKNAEFAELLLAQGTALRNKDFANICEKKALDTGNAAPAA
ncbi:MAG: hypothetical protein ACHQVS_01500 [Candidatus Babeliales bacterium]